MNNKPSLLRKEMESKRDELKGLLDKIEIELLQFDPVQIKTAEFQSLSSRKRRLVKEINEITLGIKRIKELEVDDEVVKEMDDLYNKLESGEVTIEELEKAVEEGQQEQEIYDDNVKPHNDDIHETHYDMKNVTDEDIKGSVDDLLNNL